MNTEMLLGRVALVTGASYGIGAAIAERLVKEGMTVVGCARTTAKLQDVKTKLSSEKGRFVVKTCDLQHESQILNMFSEIREEIGGVDILVNNAGCNNNNTLMEGQTDRWEAMLKLNILALSVCTREALRSMQERGVDDGHIVHIGSVAGHGVSRHPYAHMYSATKFAVRALTYGLRNELREKKSGIRVSCISPGLVQTDFAVHAGMATDTKEYHDKLVKQPIKASDIADQVLFVLAAPNHVQIHDIITHAHNERL